MFPALEDNCPQPAAERYSPIDVIRGLALFGVLIVNFETIFRAPLLELILGQRPESAVGADRLAGLLVAHVLEFKAITIFAFLFGAGVAIQAERMTSRGIRPRGFLLRRFGWLFLFGLAHLVLIWNGDILALYAVCGLMLLPALGLRWPVLAAMGAAAMALPQIGPSLPSGSAATALIAQAREVYATGGFVAILQFRWHETRLMIVPLLISILPRTVGLMYWGLAAWKRGLLRQPQHHRNKLLAALALGVALGVANTSYPAPLALAFAAGLLLWLTPHRAAALPGLAAIGRMALTNYLFQSIVLGFVFYGYGLGLFGRIGSGAAAGLGITIYVAQIQLSRLWLSQRQFGPFEYLWRSLAYGLRTSSEFWRQDPRRHSVDLITLGSGRPEMKLATVFLLSFLLYSAPPDHLTTLLEEMQRLTFAGDLASVGRLVPAVLENLDKPHRMAAIAWNQVGVYFQTQGDFMEAEQAYQRGIRLAENEAVGGLERLLLNLATLYLQTGQRAAHAEVLCHRALKQAIDVYGAASPELTRFLYILGVARQQQGDRAAARHFFQQALDLAGDSNEGKFSQGLIRGNLAHLSMLDKQWIQARESLLESIALMESSVGRLHPGLVGTHLNLARAYEHLKQWALASASIARARQITETRLRPDHPLMVEILRTSASILRNTGHGREARDLSRRAATIAKAQPKDFTSQLRVHIADLKPPAKSF